MSMLDGVSQCWWLSESCVLNWSAWSAVATVFAGVVALFVGLVPAAKARDSRARIGRAEARVAESDLRLQALHLAAGIQLLGGNSTPAHIYRVATIQFRVLNTDACRQVLPYLDVLPEELEGPLSDAISAMGIGTRVYERLAIEDGERHYDASGARTLYSTLLGTIQAAREALSLAAARKEPLEPIEEGAEELAKILRDQAQRDLIAQVIKSHHVRWNAQSN